MRAVFGWMAVLLTTSTTQALDLTCGATVPSRETAVLQADLVCTNEGAVRLETSATLDLNGHTLTYESDPFSVAVVCVKRSCKVHSSAATRGRLVGHFFNYGIYADEKLRRLIIENVEIDDFYGGVYTYNARIQLTDSEITDSWYFALLGRAVKALNVTVDNNSDYGLAATGGVIRGTNVHISQSGTAIDNTSGSVRMDGLTAVDNVDFGIRARRATLKNSALSTNGIDVGTHKSPRLRETTCETSAQLGAGNAPIGTWSVCSLD